MKIPGDPQRPFSPLRELKKGHPKMWKLSYDSGAGHVCFPFIYVSDALQHVKDWQIAFFHLESYAVNTH